MFSGLFIILYDVIQESEGQGCPFCRAEIKGTESVVVDPFSPNILSAKQAPPPMQSSSNQICSSSSSNQPPPCLYSFMISVKL